MLLIQNQQVNNLDVLQAKVKARRLPWTDFRTPVRRKQKPEPVRFNLVDCPHRLPPTIFPLVDPIGWNHCQRGSYPRRRWFDSTHRHQISHKNSAGLSEICKLSPFSTYVVLYSFMPLKTVQIAPAIAPRISGKGKRSLFLTNGASSSRYGRSREEAKSIRACCGSKSVCSTRGGQSHLHGLVAHREELGRRN